MGKDATKEIKENIEKIKKDQKKEAKKEQPEDKDKKVAELTDTCQRLQAEMQNYKKMCDKESHEFRKYCHADLISKILPILDSFELALKATTGTDDFTKGMKLIFSQLYDALEKEGLRPIDTKDQKFDPYKHEVLLTEKTDKDEQDGLIIEELQKGYMFKDKVLRYAKVKVFKK